MNSTKKRDPVAKDLRTPKYRMRIVDSKKIYSRKEKYFTKNSEIA